MRHKLLIVAFLFTALLWGIITIIRKPLDPALRIRTTYSLWVDCGDSSFEYFPYAYYRHFKIVRTYKWITLYQGATFTLRKRILTDPRLVLSKYGGRGYLRPLRHHEICSQPQMCLYYDYYETGANGLHCHSTLDYT